MPLLSTVGAASAGAWRTRFIAPLTGVEISLWGGGGGGGSGEFVKRTNLYIPNGTHYVYIGASYNQSGFYTGNGSIQLDALSSISRNVIDNVASPSSGGWSSGSVVRQIFQGWYYNQANQDYIYYPNYGEAGYGYPGAGGPGGNASGNDYSAVYSGAAGQGISAGTSFGLSGFPTSVSHGGAGGVSGFPMPLQYYYGGYTATMYGYYGTQPAASGANTGTSGSYGPPYTYTNPGSGGMTLRYPDSQQPLSSTTGTVVYLKSGGYHNYYWKSTGGFTR